MVENTDDKHLNSQDKTELEGFLKENISSDEPEIIDQTSEIENMEVHKHPHHVTHKKKWGEYFLEFLMIFLAVIMGFIAENIREHQTEKKIGRELIHSLIDDLKADTAGFDDNAQFWTTRLKGIDSLRYYIQPLLKISNTVRAYYWVEQMFEFTDFKYHDATIQLYNNCEILEISGL